MCYIYIYIYWLVWTYIWFVDVCLYVWMCMGVYGFAYDVYMDLYIGVYGFTYGLHVDVYIYIYIHMGMYGLVSIYIRFSMNVLWFVYGYIYIYTYLYNKGGWLTRTPSPRTAGIRERSCWKGNSSAERRNKNVLRLNKSVHVCDLTPRSGRKKWVFQNNSLQEWSHANPPPRPSFHFFLQSCSAQANTLPRFRHRGVLGFVGVSSVTWLKTVPQPRHRQSYGEIWHSPRSTWART